MKSIETTLGPISLDQLGKVDAHDHVIITAGDHDTFPPDFIHDDLTKIAGELVDWKNAGGGAIVDASPIDAGRSVESLQQASTISGVPIIVSSGFHKLSYYSENHWIYKKSEDELYEIIAGEITKGVTFKEPETNTPLRSGIKAWIIKLGLDDSGLNPITKKIIKASAKVVRQFNTPLMFHTEKGVPFEPLLDLLETLQVPPDKVALCHLDKNLDYNLHHEITSRGYFIEYDSMVRKTPTLEELAVVLKKLLADGLGNKILFAGDLARMSYWKNYGGKPGLAYLVTDLTSQFMNLGMTRAEIDQIWIQNPMVWLD